MKTKDQIRPVTRAVYEALRRDEWPSPAGCIDFGIRSEAHLGALQYAVINDGVSVEQLDEALGNGPALQALISPKNPYRNVTIRTDWDIMSEDAEEF